MPRNVDEIVASNPLLRPPRETCPDCQREIADQDDEGDHNTGECGCVQARALCWRRWSANECLPFSPYGRDKEDEPKVKAWIDRHKWT